MYDSHYTRTAAGYRRDAQRDYRRARRDARKAAQLYGLAETTGRNAAWLTRRPDLWDDRTPAQVEENARAWRRIADSYLRSSFRDTNSARFHNGLARTYEGMAVLPHLV